ncbi:MAG: TonB-dependent receptor [Kordiimonadaceae bacterium]|nr:TonB-dependent receptor [Kordiimonadaceae bacterium]
MGNDNREPVGSIGAHAGGNASDPIAVNEALGGAGDPFSYAGEDDNGGKRKVFGAALEINKDFEETTLTVIGAYRESEYEWAMDSTGLPPTALADLTAGPAVFGPIAVGAPETGFFYDNTDLVAEDSKQYTAEIRLASNNDGPLEWVTGAFATLEQIYRTEGIRFNALTDDSLEPNLADSTMDFEGKAIAAFAQGTYQITDTLSLTAGARYSYEEKDIIAFNTIPQSPKLQLILRAFDPAEGSDSWNNLSWKTALDWQATDDVMLYASVSTGFKSGGFTGTASIAETATTAFEPEEATNYEVGMKGDFFDSRLRLNVSAFFLDYKDLQITRFFQPLGRDFSLFITENAANAEVKGIEVEFTGILTDNIEVGGFYSYLDAEFKGFFGTPGQTGSGDFSGNKLRQAPEHSLGGHIQFFQELNEDKGSITANLSAKYQSQTFTNVDNNALDVIPSYTVVDAWLAWNSSDSKWMVQAWVKNLTDKAYRTHVFTQRGGRVAFATFAPPRTFGLTVQYEY